MDNASPTQSTCDCAITLNSGGETFRVHRERLVAICPSFELNFPMHEYLGYPEDLKHFIWYIDVQPLQFVQFNNLPASPEKAQRLIGVARIAIGLEAHELASWALEEVFLMLEISSRLFCPSAFLMTTLTMATRALDQSSGTDRFPKRIRELWDDVLCTGEWNTGTDRSALVDYLCLAEYIGDNQLIGLSYFYVLINLDADDVSSELKLSSQHLQSLLFGSHALMKMGRSATVHDRVLRDPNSDNTWKPQTNSAIKDIQGRLHSMFTVKPWAR